MAATVAFAMIGLAGLLRLLNTALPGTGTSRVRRVDDLFHLLMSAEMVAMSWTGPVPDRWGLQAAVFAVATGWFLVQALAMSSGVATVEEPAHPRPAAQRRRGCLQHAAGAAAMTWMVAVMPPGTAGASAASMPGMVMPGGPSVGFAGHGVPGALVGGCLLLSAVWWLVAAHRARRGSPRSVHPTGLPGRAARFTAGPMVGAISHAAMAAGMGAAVLVAR